MRDWSLFCVTLPHIRNQLIGYPVSVLLISPGGRETRIRSVGLGDSRGSDHEQFTGCASLVRHDASSVPVLWIVRGRRRIGHGVAGIGSRHAKCPQRGLSCAGHLRDHIGENPVAVQSVPVAALPHRHHAMWQVNVGGAIAHQPRRHDHQIWSVPRCSIYGEPGQWRHTPGSLVAHPLEFALLLVEECMLGGVLVSLFVLLRCKLAPQPDEELGPGSGPFDGKSNRDFRLHRSILSGGVWRTIANCRKAQENVVWAR